MKLLTILICLSFATSSYDVARTKVAPVIKDNLVAAIIHVESRGDDSAIGDNGLAVGCLQIHPIMVREANRLLRADSFTLSDRYSRVKSVQMFEVIRANVKEATNEKVARCWNGGGNGYKKRATLKYWNKVKKQL